MFSYNNATKSATNTTNNETLLHYTPVFKKNFPKTSAFYFLILGWAWIYFRFPVIFKPGFLFA